MVPYTATKGEREMNKQYYIDSIIELMEKTDDLSLLEFIYQLLLKS